MLQSLLRVLPVDKADEAEAARRTILVLHHGRAEDLAEWLEQLDQVAVIKHRGRCVGGGRSVTATVAVTATRRGLGREVLDVEVGRAGLFLTLSRPLPLRLEIGDLESDQGLCLLWRVCAVT